MFDPASVEFRGPLRPYIDGFWSELKRQGYSPSSGGQLLRLAAHVSRWLENRGLGASDLTVERVARFVAYHRRQGYRHCRSSRGVEPLLSHLRSIGVAPQQPTPVDTATDRFLRAYADYLAGERGLVTTTIRRYTDFARRFLDVEFDSALPDWRALAAADVIRFVSQELRRSSATQCKWMVCQLRSLLRYLHVQGLLTHDLAACVPAVAGWRMASLPRGLEAKQVERILKSFDRRTLVGCRGHAVLCLLARLGLRAGEVAALRLEDVDWRGAELVIRGKPRRESRLPLPSDVGRALTAYLRRRPRVTARAVFLRVHAPHQPVTGHTISGLAGRALRRAGFSVGSAHVFRHTAATQMLRRGASLAEVGHVLRHRHVDTTAIYAKVDHAVLRTLAQPWPVGAP